MATERTVLVRLKADPNPFIRGMAEAGAAVGGLRKEINTTNDRTAWLTQGILALAPALVPLGAASVPVFTGIATQMTVAGVAAGTLALGFHGIGAALTALNAYQLEPTDANLLKLHESMQKLSVEGRDFVRFLDQLSGIGTSLSHTAQKGMFPGMAEGLEHLVTLAPQVKRIIREVSEGLGELADEAGAGLAGPKWEEFFKFLEHDAKPILLDLGRTVGNFATGLAHLLVDFLPESQKFSSGLLDISRNFERWADQLDRTEGFEHFLAYVDKAGPQALDFLGSLVNAFLAIVEAAAPVGDVMLPALTVLLNTFAKVANTPLGSIFIALAAAMSVYGRAVAIGSNLTGGMNRNLGMANAESIKTAFSFRQLSADILTYARAARTADAATTGVAERQAAARTGIIGWGKAAGRVGGQAALLVGATSGIADKMHLGNTATLAMAGSLAGPYGAALGGAVGLVLDFAAAGGNATVKTDELTASLNQQTGALTKNSSAAAFKALQDAGVITAAQNLGLSLSEVRDAALGGDDALRSINGQLDAYLGKTQAGYTAGGAPTVDPEAARNARIVQQAITGTTGAIAAQRKQILLQQQFQGKTNKTTLEAANAQRDLAAATRASKQAAASSAQQFKTLGDDVDNTKVSLQKWIHQLAAQAKAVTEFGNNAKRAADRGLRQGLIEELEKLGPAGALRMKQLANASQSEIGRANKAWLNLQRGVQSAQDALVKATNHPYAINVQNQQALDALRQVAAQLAALRSKTITVTTKHVTGGSVKAGYDTGGFTGWGGHYEPAGIVHRNELVLPENVVKGDWGFLKSRYGYLPGFSEGGLVGMSLGATPQSAGRGGGVTVSFEGGQMKVTGTLNTPFGPSEIEGIAEGVYTRNADADREFDRKLADR